MKENLKIQKDIENNKKQINKKGFIKEAIFNKQNLKKGLLTGIWLMLYAAILCFFTHSIGMSSIGEMLCLLAVVITANKNYVIVAYLITLALLLIARALLKNTFISNIVVTVITTIISIISYYKYSILAQPFVPNDVLLIGNAEQIAGFGLSIPSFNLIYCVISLAFVLFLEYKIEKKYNFNEKKLEWKKEWYRIPLLIIGVVVIVLLCFNAKRFEKTKLNNDLGNLYNYSGAVATFFMHLGDFYAKAPAGYSEKNIEMLKEKYESNLNAGDREIEKENYEEDLNIEGLETSNNTNNEIYSIKNSKENSNEKINVIFIMNESFSDPTKIEDVKYSIDPLGDIQNLAKNDRNCKIGSCITPSFGGGTSLPEFEALTGLTSFFIEKQIFPYTSYITSDMNSIVREYAKNGYETIGLHTNTKTFYNRSNVYKFLGFNETIFEEDIENPLYKGGNISDEEFKNQIINKFEKDKGTSKFLFGVTMQNHMPYSKKEYEKYDITVTSDKYTEANIKSLTNYVQGVYDGNKLYVELAEYLKNYEEPTILVMFGDHLPSLEKKLFYNNSGYSTIDWFETPYIMWSNCGVDFSSISEYMTPSNLGLTLFKLSGNTLPWYMKPFEQIYEEYPIINNQIIVNKEMDVVRKEEIKNIELIKNANILQYDLLIKKRYIPCIK